MRCSSTCSRKATYFGSFAGGICEEHAVKMAAEGSVSMFHPEYRERLRVLLSETLNGKLFNYELPNGWRRRGDPGYWARLEEQMVRAELAKEGLVPGTPGYWTALSDRIKENHKNDPSPWEDHRGLARFGGIRQQAGVEHHRKKEQAVDRALKALEEIAAGHNDPRTLAQSVLSDLNR